MIYPTRESASKRSKSMYTYTTSYLVVLIKRLLAAQIIAICACTVDITHHATLHACLCV